MKFHIDIDCTPEEARRFLGLPDVGPMQQAMMDQVQQRMERALEQMDPETLMKMWLPAGLESWEQLQKAFWQQFTGGASGAGGGGPGGGEKGGQGGPGGKSGKGGGGR